MNNKEKIENSVKSYIHKKDKKKDLLSQMITYINKENSKNYLFKTKDMIEFGQFCRYLNKDNKEILRENPDITVKELLNYFLNYK